jgi:sugar phosphate isomerase/epimerase
MKPSHASQLINPAIHQSNNPMSTASSRREFLKRSATAAAATCVGLELAQSARAADGKIPLGVQLYSVRDQCKNDLIGTISAISKIGYKGVEFAGYHGRSATELRRILDDHNLVACGTHTPYESVLADKLKETVEFNRTIGNKFLIVPSMNARTKEEWLEKAKLFDEIADKIKPEGMFVGYHAHAQDFKKFGDETIWEIFVGNTKPEVIAQLDTSNCHDGGGDPVAMLKKFPGRTRSIHIKAAGGGPDAVIGEDKLDWKTIFAWCQNEGGTKWYVLEHETSKDPLDAVKRSYETLKKFDIV